MTIPPIEPVDAEAAIAGSHETEIANSRPFRRMPNPNPPISLRLSEPLLELLDTIAATQHRKRSNLIQHILWEYVRAHEEAVAPLVPSQNGSARSKRSA